MAVVVHACKTIEAGNYRFRHTLLAALALPVYSHDIFFNITAVCNVLTTSANRAPCACATISVVNFGSLDMNPGSLLDLDSPDSTLVIVVITEHAVKSLQSHVLLHYLSACAWS